jgi:hypothetical protein
MLSYFILGMSTAAAVILLGVGIARHQPVALVDSAVAQGQCCAPKSPKTQCQPC